MQASKQTKPIANITHESIDAKVLNKILANCIKQYRNRILYNDKKRFLS